MEKRDVERFFEIQSKIDELAYWLTVMDAFLSVADLNKNDLFWDEVVNFYKLLEQRAKSIREKAERFLGEW
ncbi:MAG: hypothetical protein QXJ64_08980 [Thermosphaera sp.]